MVGEIGQIGERKAKKLGRLYPDLMVGSLHAGDCGEALTAPDFHQGDRKLTARQVGRGAGKAEKMGASIDIRHLRF